jgi:excisionase family DNA binding protein
MSKTKGARRVEDLPAMLAVEEAASFLRIGRNSSCGPVHSRRLPSLRIGRRFLVPRLAVEKFPAEIGAGSEREGDRPRSPTSRNKGPARRLCDGRPTEGRNCRLSSEMAVASCAVRLTS